MGHSSNCFFCKTLESSAQRGNTSERLITLGQVQGSMEHICRRESSQRIFALNADAVSEFRVYIFRGERNGKRGGPHKSHNTTGESKLRRLAGDGNMTRDDLLIGGKDAGKVLKCATVT